MRGMVLGALASLLLSACGSAPAMAALPAPPSAPSPPSASTPVDRGEPYSRGDSCVKIDQVFELANGKGAFSPLYGFANVDPEIDVRLLPLRKQVLEAYGAAAPRIEASIAPHAQAFAGFLRMLVATGEQRVRGEATAPTAESTDAMNRFARDYAAFYDACASDLGITKKDQRAFHAVVLDPATGAAPSP